MRRPLFVATRCLRAPGHTAAGERTRIRVPVQGSLSTEAEARAALLEVTRVVTERSVTGCPLVGRTGSAIGQDEVARLQTDVFSVLSRCKAVAPETMLALYQYAAASYRVKIPPDLRAVLIRSLHIHAQKAKGSTIGPAIALLVRTTPPRADPCLTTLAAHLRAHLLEPALSETPGEKDRDGRQPAPTRRSLPDAIRDNLARNRKALCADPASISWWLYSLSFVKILPDHEKLWHLLTEALATVDVRQLTLRETARVLYAFSVTADSFIPQKVRLCDHFAQLTRDKTTCIAPEPAASQPGLAVDPGSPRSVGSAAAYSGRGVDGGSQVAVSPLTRHWEMFGGEDAALQEENNDLPGIRELAWFARVLATMGDQVRWRHVEAVEAALSHSTIQDVNTAGLYRGTTIPNTAGATAKDIRRLVAALTSLFKAAPKLSLSTTAAHELFVSLSRLLVLNCRASPTRVEAIGIVDLFSYCPSPDVAERVLGICADHFSTPEAVRSMPEHVSFTALRAWTAVAKRKVQLAASKGAFDNPADRGPGLFGVLANLSDYAPIPENLNGLAAYLTHCLWLPRGWPARIRRQLSAAAEHMRALLARQARNAHNARGVSRDARLFSHRLTQLCRGRAISDPGGRPCPVFKQYAVALLEWLEGTDGIRAYDLVMAAQALFTIQRFAARDLDRGALDPLFRRALSSMLAEMTERRRVSIWELLDAYAMVVERLYRELGDGDTGREASMRLGEEGFTVLQAGLRVLLEKERAASGKGAGSPDEDAAGDALFRRLTELGRGTVEAVSDRSDFKSVAFRHRSVGSLLADAEFVRAKVPESSSWIPDSALEFFVALLGNAGSRRPSATTSPLRTVARGVDHKMEVDNPRRASLHFDEAFMTVRGMVLRGLHNAEGRYNFLLEAIAEHWPYHLSFREQLDSLAIVASFCRSPRTPSSGERPRIDCVSGNVETLVRHVMSEAFNRPMRVQSRELVGICKVYWLLELQNLALFEKLYPAADRAARDPNLHHSDIIMLLSTFVKQHLVVEADTLGVLMTCANRLVGAVDEEPPEAEAETSYTTAILAFAGAGLAHPGLYSRLEDHALAHGTFYNPQHIANYYQLLSISSSKLPDVDAILATTAAS
ncbi:hypothetical protein DIPPA_16472 [Diplonema papillatum]|nr:hypothetical protein DIPPA_16472 [Diplonema papillatum]